MKIVEPGDAHQCVLNRGDTPPPADQVDRKDDRAVRFGEVFALHVKDIWQRGLRRCVTSIILVSQLLRKTFMNFVRKFALSALVSLAFIPPALAQNMAPASTLVGQWVYSPGGDKIGSVRAVGPAGVELMVGGYFQPGSHVETVPVRALSLADGRVILQPDTLQAALNR